MFDPKIFVSGTKSEKLTVDDKKAIERHWKDKINGSSAGSSVSGAKFYVLSMFPYSSGNLHMGHVRVYTISDAIARFHRMNGRMVIHPIGWDSFGLPAENAAFEKGQHPEEWTKSLHENDPLENIASMKEQLLQFNYSFDWDRELSTCDPEYYKWTQYLFLKMFEKGLAYQKEALVNWDPVDLTVLADEQVDSKGHSWRSGAKVEKKSLKQWFLRTTRFSKSLWDSLLDPMLINWQAVRKVQQHWIGECIGCHLTFELEVSPEKTEDTLSIWTSTPEAVFGAAFVALSPGHAIVEKFFSNGHDECRLPVLAIHPFTKAKLPVFVSENVPYPENCSSYLGIPGACIEAEEFAKRHDLPIVNVYNDEGGNEVQMVNSGEFSGLSVMEAKEKICAHAKELGVGGDLTSSKLRDWLISRQRYWGTPIPVVHCSRCKAVPVPYEDLPVTLPKLEMADKGSLSLSANKTWAETTCPKCRGPAARETDTMDTFVDSSWYFLRFLDPKHRDGPFRSDVVDRQMPVDIYIGGMEHAFLHLYYARFVTHFWHSLGLISHREPFQRLLVQGFIKGQTFRSKDSEKYLRRDEVMQEGNSFVEKSSGAPVTVSWEKMSKSKRNGVEPRVSLFSKLGSLAAVPPDLDMCIHGASNEVPSHCTHFELLQFDKIPQEVINEYGIDTTRLLVLAGVAPATERNWSPDLFPGVLNWQQKLWDLVTILRTSRGSLVPRDTVSDEEFSKWEYKIFEDRNKCVKQVNYGFLTAYSFNGAISYMQSLTKSLLAVPPVVTCHSSEHEKALADLIRLLAPMAPHFASELWVGLASAPGRQSDHLSWGENVLQQPWPDVDANYNLDLEVKDSTEIRNTIHCIKMPRYKLDVLSHEAAAQIVENSAEVLKYLDGRVPFKTSFKLKPGFGAELKLHLRVSKKRKQTDVKTI